MIVETIEHLQKVSPTNSKFFPQKSEMHLKGSLALDVGTGMEGIPSLQCTNQWALNTHTPVVRCTYLKLESLFTVCSHKLMHPIVFFS